MANLLVSDGTSDEDLAGSGVDYGDYRLSSYHDGLFYPVWSDNSNSTGDNPNGAGAQFDQYTARIIAVENTPPTVNVSPVAGNEGSAIATSATVTDPTRRRRRRGPTRRSRASTPVPRARSPTRRRS